MNIQVMFKSFLKVTTGVSSCEQSMPEGSTVYDLAVALGKKFGKEVADYLIDPDTGQVSVLFSCNKKLCTKDQLIEEGDVISIFPAIVGG